MTPPNEVTDDEVNAAIASYCDGNQPDTREAMRTALADFLQSRSATSDAAIENIALPEQPPDVYVPDTMDFACVAQPAKPALQPLTDEQIVNAMCADGCERIESFYFAGPVQKAAVWSFASAIKAQPVPAGMCLVPIEPTVEMIKAMREVFGEYVEDTDSDHKRIYSAMIAAHIKAKDTP